MQVSCATRKRVWCSAVCCVCFARKGGWVVRHQDGLGVALLCPGDTLVLKMALDVPTPHMGREHFPARGLSCGEPQTPMGFWHIFDVFSFQNVVYHCHTSASAAQIINHPQAASLSKPRQQSQKSQESSNKPRNSIKWSSCTLQNFYPWSTKVRKLQKRNPRERNALRSICKPRDYPLKENPLWATISGNQ